jgi:DNA-directed RNA polymerase, omega subunit family protein
MANVNRTGASGGGQSPKKNGVKKHMMPSGRYYTVDAKGNKRYYAANNTELNATYFLQKEGLKLDKNKKLVKNNNAGIFDKDAATKKRFKVKGSKTGRTYIIDKKGKKHYYSADGMEITETHFNKTERKNSPKKVRKNDGNLTLGEKAKHFGKGMLRGITSLFTDENGDFSVKQTLKTVGTAVIVTATAAAVVAAGIVSAPVAATILVGTGVVMGGIKIYNGIKAANSAKTNDEAAAAYQQMGEGTTDVGLSLLFKKGISKGMGKAGEIGKITRMTASHAGKGNLRARAEAVIAAEKAMFGIKSKNATTENKAPANQPAQNNSNGVQAVKNEQGTYDVKIGNEPNRTFSTKEQAEAYIKAHNTNQSVPKAVKNEQGTYDVKIGNEPNRTFTTKEQADAYIKRQTTSANQPATKESVANEQATPKLKGYKNYKKAINEAKTLEEHQNLMDKVQQDGSLSKSKKMKLYKTRSSEVQKLRAKQYVEQQERQIPKLEEQIKATKQQKTDGYSEHASKDVNATKKELADLKETQRQAQRTMEAKVKAEAKARQEKAAIDKQLKEAQAKFNEAQNADLAQMDAKISSLENALEVARNRGKGFRGADKPDLGKVKKLEAQIQKLKSERGMKKAELEKSRQDVETLKQQQIAAKSKLDKLSSEVETASNKVNDLAVKVQNKETALENLAKERRTAGQKIVKAQENMNKAQEKIKALEDEIAKTNKEIAELSKKPQENIVKISKAKSRLLALKTSLNDLKNSSLNIVGGTLNAVKNGLPVAMAANTPEKPVDPMPDEKMVLPVDDEPEKPLETVETQQPEKTTFENAVTDPDNADETPATDNATTAEDATPTTESQSPEKSSETGKSDTTQKIDSSKTNAPTQETPEVEKPEEPKPDEGTTPATEVTDGTKIPEGAKIKNRKITGPNSEFSKNKLAIVDGQAYEIDENGNLGSKLAVDRRGILLRNRYYRTDDTIPKNAEVDLRKKVDGVKTLTYEFVDEKGVEHRFTMQEGEDGKYTSGYEIEKVNGKWTRKKTQEHFNVRN